MAFKDIGKMFKQIDQDIASVTLLGAIKAAEKQFKNFSKRDQAGQDSFLTLGKSGVHRANKQRVMGKEESLGP